MSENQQKTAIFSDFNRDNIGNFDLKSDTASAYRG